MGETRSTVQFDTLVNLVELMLKEFESGLGMSQKILNSLETTLSRTVTNLTMIQVYFGLVL